MTLLKKLAVTTVAAGAMVAGLQSPAAAASMVSCFGEEGAQAVKAYYHHTSCYAGKGSIDEELYLTWRIESRNNKVRIDYVGDNGNGAPGSFVLDKNQIYGGTIQSPLILVKRITIY